MHHRWADIHPDAKIGEGVEIGPFTSIHGDVMIGDGTRIEANVTIMDGARIGKHCHIFPGAVISAIPQDLKFAGEERGTVDRHKTTVGNHSLLMAYTHLGHDTFVGNHCILANAANIAGHVTIDDYAILEGVVAVQQFVHIGTHSFIAGGSLVRKNVPPYIKAAREPLSYAGVNTVGLRRRGFESETISQIEEAYRYIYIRNKNLEKAIADIQENMPSTKELEEIMHFVRQSQRGIIRGVQDV